MHSVLYFNQQVFTKFSTGTIMNRLLTMLLCLLVFSCSLAGCLDDNTDENDSEEDTTVPEMTPEEPVNGTGGNSGGGIGDSDNTGGSEDDDGDAVVNETGDNTGSGGGSNSGGGSGTTPSEPTNQTDDEGSSDDGTGGNTGDTGDGDSSDGGGDTTDDNTQSGTTACGSGDGTYSATMVAFDISANPDFTNIGGIEIDCSSNLIYGYVWDSVEEIEHFISVDPSNGAVNSLVELTGIDYVTGIATYAGGEYFTIMRGGSSVYLVHVSVADPSQYSMTEFDFTNHPELDDVSGIEYDHANNLIYGYASDGSNTGSGTAGPGQQQGGDVEPMYVVTVDPVTGLVTKHTELEDIAGVAQGASAFDGSHYYLTVRTEDTGYSMAKIDVLDFSISYSSVLSSTNEDLESPNGFEINLNNGLIYGYAWDSVAEEEVFISYEISSESIVQVGVISGVQYVTTDSTNGGNDFYAIMSGADRVLKLIHIQY